MKFPALAVGYAKDRPRGNADSGPTGDHRRRFSHSSRNGSTANRIALVVCGLAARPWYSRDTRCGSSCDKANRLQERP